MIAPFCMYLYFSKTSLIVICTIPTNRPYILEEQGPCLSNPHLSPAPDEQCGT